MKTIVLNARANDLSSVLRVGCPVCRCKLGIVQRGDSWTSTYRPDPPLVLLRTQRTGEVIDHREYGRPRRTGHVAPQAARPGGYPRVPGDNLVVIHCPNPVCGGRRLELDWEAIDDTPDDA